VRHTFIVPVRKSKAGSLALQTGRLRSGERVGLAFTSEASLLLTLGPSQEWIRLGGQALTDMLVPLGVDQVRVDPRPIGELEVGGTPQEPAPVGPARPGSGPGRAGSACPSGHYRSAAKRLDVRRRPLASGLAATRRPGVTSSGAPAAPAAPAAPRVTSLAGLLDGKPSGIVCPAPVGMRSRRNARRGRDRLARIRSVSGWPSESLSPSGGPLAPGSLSCA
jgi:hypothetical protein